MNLDGSNSRDLTDEQDNFFPSFSSDGEGIIYAEDAVFDVDLLAMDADGENKRRVTDSSRRAPT